MAARKNTSNLPCALVHPNSERLSVRYTEQEEDMIRTFTQPGPARITKWQYLVDALNENLCSCVKRTEYGVAQKRRRMNKEEDIPQPCTLINRHTGNVLQTAQPYIRPDSSQPTPGDHNRSTSPGWQSASDQIAESSQPRANGGVQPHSTHSHAHYGQEIQPGFNPSECRALGNLDTKPYVGEAQFDQHFSLEVPFLFPQNDWQTINNGELFGDLANMPFMANYEASIPYQPGNTTAMMSNF